ncbi:NAD-P-binding protein [Stereum hirsutum FP-91666 SS1]|uniref:NAD-P-binding protein n=1 Tax=Stereum hirsutum (strain FP-91666) TaxID=721885 RepID=UPI000440CECD|nr:NAD-P-binding protein [Stereum hirsutum FP-91666 SS1]EIM87341.1 NAD-P-binding protein [Stereum hirsutum FP-91666 SS1]
MPLFAPGGLPGILYSQLFVEPQLEPNLSFTGQTVIVTGSNTGLGFFAAQEIAQRGAAKVILAVHTISKGEAAAQAIRESLSQSPRTATEIEVWHLNLSSYQSVKDFAARAAKLDRLDVLLENAGVATLKFEIEEEDEMMVTTNVVSTTLLALLMLPKLRETAERFGVMTYLTIVSCDLAFFAKFEERNAQNIFEKMKDPKSNLMDRYDVSKLLDVFVVREIATRISTSSSTKPTVIVNAVNPGICQTSLRRNFTGFQANAIAFVESPLYRKASIGARTLVHAASAGKESHGQYLSDCHVSLSPLDIKKWGNEEELRKRIWGELMMKLERVEPGVSQIV